MYVKMLKYLYISKNYLRFIMDECLSLDIFFEKKNIGKKIQNLLNIEEMFYKF